MDKKTISSPDEIQAFLSNNAEWTYGNDTLRAAYTCASFEDAVSYINQTAGIFSELDHHPKIENTYNRLTFALTTHDAGDKVTGIDIAVAKRISEVMSSLD